METAALKKIIEKVAPEALLQCVNFGKSGEGCAWLESSSLPKTCAGLAEHPELGLDWLENLSAMQMDDVIVITYFLRSRESNHSAVLRSSVALSSPDERVRFPSITGVWPAAALQEAEVSEMFGVDFLLGDEPSVWQGSSILPDGWKGFPLRKSYTIESEITTPDAGGIE